jgi:hypothetical protein
LTWESNENHSQLTVSPNDITLLVAIQVVLCVMSEIGMFGYCVSVRQRVNIMAASHTMGMWLINKTTSISYYQDDKAKEGRHR